MTAILVTAFTVALAGVAALLATPVLAEAPSGCVACHTDDAALKALFVPPKIGGGEGEG